MGLFEKIKNALFEEEYVEIEEKPKKPKKEIIKKDVERPIAKKVLLPKKEEVKPLLADGLYLFSTTTCPNCRMAKNFLHQASFEFEEVIANENPELTRALNINQAPTLVEVKDGQVQLIENVSNIRRYIESIVLVKA